MDDSITKFTEAENTLVVAGSYGWRGVWHGTGVIIRGSTREIFVIMEYFCVLIVLLVT